MGFLPPQNFTLTVVDDGVPELDETFYIDLVQALGGSGSLAFERRLPITILANDVRPWYGMNF